MKIDLATEKSVLVELSCDDLSAFDLTFDALDYENERTRLAVESVMRCVREETGRSFETDRLQIDVLPNRAGGCLMIFTDCTGNQKQEAFALFQSDSINDLIDAARVWRTEGESGVQSRLLRCGKTFSLLVRSASAKTLRLLGEFAPAARLNRTQAAALSEQQQTLLEENALEILGGKRAQL